MPNKLLDPTNWLLQRNAMAADDTIGQQAIAPLEHREYAKEYVQDNPITGPLAIGAAIPAYYAYKKISNLIGRKVSRTPASLDQMFAGYEGIYQGMRANIKDSLGPKPEGFGVEPKPKVALARGIGVRG